MESTAAEGMVVETGVTEKEGGGRQWIVLSPKSPWRVPGRELEQP